MADVILIAAVLAFFVICVLYVGWCDRIIGPDEFEPGTAQPASTASPTTSSPTSTTTTTTPALPEKVPA